MPTSATSASPSAATWFAGGYIRENKVQADGTLRSEYEALAARSGNMETGPMNESHSKGATPHADGCRFRVWAPHADAVFVTGTFNDWHGEAHPMEAEPGGWWSRDVPGAKPGDEYRYRILNGDQELSRIDPYARRVTSSVGNAIIPAPRAEIGGAPFTPPPPDELVIYELHVGTFGKQGTDPGPGDLEGAIARLAHLEALGVTAVEVMPLAEFAGGFSWGYNPAHIFTVESEYGTPHDFREFVTECHTRGIAVIVDVVYNHLGPSDLSIWRFDGWSENDGGGIYFYNDQRAKTPWGETRPDYGRNEVREFIRDNTLMWLREYGADGLRWDMTAYIRNTHGRDGDPDGDLPDGWSLMQWVNGEIAAARPGAFTIAEDLQNNALLTRSRDEGGAGFAAQWAAPFVHAIRAALTTAEDSHRDMSAVRDAILHRYDRDAFERVIYTESHDEVANGKARLPEEVDPGRASSWAAKKKSALGAVLVFTAPGIPMIFQGQELLEDDWFHDRDPIDWTKKDRFAGIVRLYTDLIALRRNRRGTTAGLRGQEADVFHVDEDGKLVAYHRWMAGGPGDSVVVVANFSAQPREDYAIPFPAAGAWTVRFNSDSRDYESEFGNLGDATVQAEPAEGDGPPARGTISVAAYSALILSQ